MSRDTVNDTPITRIEELAEYIAQGAKPRSAWRIGTEHEKIPFYMEGNSPVPYDGPAGIRAILEGMKARLGWDPIMDEGYIIGLVEPEKANGISADLADSGKPTGPIAISLEPGGQFELSGAPVASLHETCSETRAHMTQVREVAEPMGIRFLGVGGSPKWSYAETPRMPKSRAKIMTNYMPRVGKDGLNMMYRTCTVQVNLDFSSETDMRRKMQVGVKLQPIATALFAMSPFTEGKPNGFLSWRSDIWRETDNCRTGILPFIFGDDYGFADYVEWALDVPMYFIIRDRHYIDCTHVTFRQFMNGALKDTVPGDVPTIGDWANHLTTTFPEVRLKRYIEMRGADVGPLRRICALSAFWVGLLYDSEALNAAEALTRHWSYPEIRYLRDEVPIKGLHAILRNRSVLEIAREVLEISRTGLRNRAMLNSEGFDETVYLAAIEEVIARGTTSAEEMLSQYNTIWGGSVEPAFVEYAY